MEPPQIPGLGNPVTGGKGGAQLSVATNPAIQVLKVASNDAIVGQAARLTEAGQVTVGAVVSSTVTSIMH